MNDEMLLTPIILSNYTLHYIQKRFLNCVWDHKPSHAKFPTANAFFPPQLSTKYLVSYIKTKANTIFLPVHLNCSLLPSFLGLLLVSKADPFIYHLEGISYTSSDLPPSDLYDHTFYLLFHSFIPVQEIVKVPYSSEKTLDIGLRKQTNPKFTFWL